MAKMRNVVAGKFSGNAGSFRFGQTAGTSIVGERVYTNKSKGNGASYTQRVQRCKIANIANAFAVLRPVLIKAFEGKKANQSWYNAFASANLGRTPFCLPKDAASEGYSLMDGLQIAKGTLPAIYNEWVDGTWESGIRCTVEGTLEDMTVATLSANLVASNDYLRYGDQITFVMAWDSWATEGFDTRKPHTAIFELTLSDTDSRKFGDLPNYSLMTFSVTDEFLCPFGGDLMAVVQSRVVNGSLRVSNTFLAADNVASDSYAKYKTEAYIQKAAASYGYQEQALLDPDL